VFVSEQLSDTDMGSKAPKKVRPTVSFCLPPLRTSYCFCTRIYTRDETNFYLVQVLLKGIIFGRVAPADGSEDY
jgi:hypothetical protein